MAIILEKILTISARDYCEMYGKNLCDYEAIGIHSSIHAGRDSYYKAHGLREIFAQEVPDKAEVVVNYVFSTGGDSDISSFYASGTALIPKQISSSGTALIPK